VPKFAILGDVHGNYEAFETVLGALRKESPDAIYFVGDVVGYGPDPDICLAKLKELGSTWVAGNHDWAVSGNLSLEYFNPYAREAVDWTVAKLSKEDIALLNQQKLITTVNGFTLSHSTLHAPELFGYIDTLYAAYLCFEAMETNIAFVGHSHIPVIFLQNANDQSVAYTLQSETELSGWGKALVNVGSIGQPRDEDPRAAYCIYDSDKQIVRIERIEYDIKKTAQKIIDAGLPRVLAERLYVGR